MFQHNKKFIQTNMITAFVFITVTSIPAFADWGDLSSKGPLPITIDEAPKLFKQCSRLTPKHDGNVWLPTKPQIDNLEVNLPKYLAKHSNFHMKDPRTISQEYRGQYVSFERNGGSYIYASYLPEGRVTGFGNALTMCDGGPNFWGIVYNAATREFSELQFNGR